MVKGRRKKSLKLDTVCKVEMERVVFIQNRRILGEISE